MQLRSSAYWPRSQYKLTVETKLVEVGVVVRDSHGHTVGSLQRDDFELEDAGKKREITAFSAESSTRPAAAAADPASKKATLAAPEAPKIPPRFLGLFFDDFSMSGAEMAQAKTAAKRFLKQGLASDDRIAIFSVSRLQVLPFTTDVAKVSEAIDRLNFSSRAPYGGDCPAFTPYDAYLIANRLDTPPGRGSGIRGGRGGVSGGGGGSSGLEIKAEEAFRCGACASRSRGGPSPAELQQCQDQVVEPRAKVIWEQVRITSRSTLGTIEDIADYMASLPGKRVLLLASSGFLSGTLERELDETASHALHGQVVVNSLDAKGLYTDDLMQSMPGANARSLTRMQLLGSRAKDESNDSMAVLASSTGGLFFHNNNDLDAGFRELGLAPEFFYSLGFTPQEKPDGRYHKLKVRLKPAGQYSVQARPGYYAVAAKAEPPAPERSIDKEILAASALDDVPARLTASPIKTPNGEPALRIVLRLDVKRLRFVNQTGVRRQKITLIAALFDDHANFVAGKEAEVEFALKEDTYNRMADGFEAGLTLVAPSGKYRLRGVVQEAVEGKLTTSTQPVEVQ